MCLVFTQDLCPVVLKYNSMLHANKRLSLKTKCNMKLSLFICARYMSNLSMAVKHSPQCFGIVMDDYDKN